MANIEKTIEVIFGASDTNLTSTLDGLGDGFNKFDAAVQSAADPVASFTKDLLAIEGAIAVAGAALVGFSINEAGTFKGSINEIAALFNATAKQSETLGDTLLTFAKDSVFAIEDINQATFTAISTGTEWTEVTKVLAQAQQLAVAGSSSLGDATAVLTRTMNAYGLEADQARSVSESLFVAAQLGDTNLTKLSGAFGKLATDANASNVELDAALSSVVALTVAGISTEESMTKLKQLFIALSAPSATLAAALGGMTLETNSLQEIIQKLNAVTGGSSAAMRALIPNQEAVTAALVLSGAGAETFNDALEAMANKAGKVSTAFDSMENDIDKINQRIVTNFRAVLIEIGDDMLDEYGGIGNAIIAIFQSIGASLDEGTLSQLTAAVESFLGDVERTLSGVVDALPDALNKLDFSGLLSSFTNLGNEFANAFDTIFGKDLDLSKPEDLAKALQNGVNILSSFVDITSGIISQFKPIFEALGAAGDKLSTTSESSATAVGKLLGAITVVGELGTALGGFLVAVNNLDIDFKRVVNVLVGGVGLLKNAFEVGFGSIVVVLANFNATYLEGLDLLTLGLDKTTAQAAETARDIANSLELGLSIDTEEFENSLKLVTGELSLFSDTAKTTGEQVNASLSSYDDSAGVLDTLKESYVDLGEKLLTVGLSTEEAQVYLNNLDTTQQQLIVTTDEWHDGLNQLVEDQLAIDKATRAATEAGLSYNVVYKDGIASVKTWGDTVDKAVKPTAELAEEQKSAIEHARKLELTLLQLASNEKIASLELSVNLEIAGVEANAAIIVAAYDSIASSVDSTNDLISELFSHDAPDWDKFGFDTQRSIDEANKRAEALTKSQIELNDAQVASIEARTKQLAQGGTEISISADNLAPELQRVLEGLIDNIRIQAVNQGVELLL